MNYIVALLTLCSQPLNYAVTKIYTTLPESKAPTRDLLLYIYNKRLRVCRAYTPGTARKEADRLLVESPCTPTKTRAM
jgi:hypothetical protein